MGIEIMCSKRGNPTRIIMETAYKHLTLIIEWFTFSERGVVNPPRMFERVCDQYQLIKHFTYFILKHFSLKWTFRQEVRSLASL